MDNEVKVTKAMASSRMSDENMTPENARVRNLLIGLPRVNCPVGFEFRLQRRIEALESGIRPVRSERFGWGFGWAGLGLGLATAFVVAVVAFDFSFTPGKIMITGAPVVATSQPITTSPAAADQNAADPNSIITPEQENPEIDASAVAEPTQQMAAVNDSNAAKNPPTELPENLYHMVGGNNP